MAYDDDNVFLYKQTIGINNEWDINDPNFFCELSNIIQKRFNKNVVTVSACFFCRGMNEEVGEEKNWCDCVSPRRGGLKKVFFLVSVYVCACVLVFLYIYLVLVLDYFIYRP